MRFAFLDLPTNSGLKSKKFQKSKNSKTRTSNPKIRVSNPKVAKTGTKVHYPSMHPMVINQLTDDEYERALFLEDVIEEIEPDDPYFQEDMRISCELAAIRKRMGSKSQQVPYLYLQGYTRQQIAEQTDTSYATVCKHLNSKDSVRAMVLHQRQSSLQNGPSMEARTAMLWRIAYRNEDTKPTVSMQALDILNKQQGIYKPDQVTTTPTQVVIAQYTVNNYNDPQTDLPQQEFIEGDFHPIEVSTP